ncbi:hypothetical protein MRX96_050042 [Rhipicephalus microplus]
MSPPTNFEVYDQDDYDYHEYPDDMDTEGDNNNEGTTMSLKDFAQKSEKSYKTFITETIKLVSNGSVTENQTNEIANNIISFEKNLSKLAFGAKKSTENMTITQLSKKISDKFPMAEVLQKDFTVVGITIENNTNVTVKDVEYYNGVGTLLETMKNTNILANYILWTYVKRMAEAEGTLLHKIYLEYKRNTSISEYDKSKSTDDKQLQCLYQLLQSDVMYTAGASYYIKAKFNGTSKSEVTKIFKFISSEFRTFIENNTWMSKNIKKAAIERLNNMTEVIGYPDWMMEDDTIDFMYKYGMPCSSRVADTLAEAYATIASLTADLRALCELERLRRPPDAGTLLAQCVLCRIPVSAWTSTMALWPTSPHTLRANRPLTGERPLRVNLHMPGVRSKRYTLLSAMTLGCGVNVRGPGRACRHDLAAIRQRLGVSTALNLFLRQAAIGSEPSTRQSNQSYGDFWDNSTKAKFCNYSKCLNNTKQCWDTRDVHNSSYQHFLGYTSIRLSHEALKKSKDNYTGASLLPDEKLNSEDKIFFTGYGSLYCPYSIHNSTKKVEARYYIQEQDLPKSLNEVVSKYKEFNSTFNCSGDLTDTCNLIPPQLKRDVITC